MITLDVIRRYALALPEVDEKPHFGRPGFRVRDRLFASVHLDGDHPSVIVNVDQAAASAAIRSTAAVLEEIWRTHGQRRIFVGLRVDLAAASKERCQEMVEVAWRNKAPKHLVAEYEDRLRAKNDSA